MSGRAAKVGSQAEIDGARAPSRAQAPVRSRSERWQWPTAVFWTMGIGVPLAVMGVGPFARLTESWLSDVENSHGLFVLPLSGYFIWLKRRDLARLPAGTSWAGVVLVAIGLSGAILTALEPSLFRSNFSLIVTAIGLVIALAGWQRLRAIALPLAFLFFMLPMPSPLRGRVTQPLQLFASDSAAAALRVLGVPVYRTGSIIELPGGSTLEVGQACSGMSLMMGFLALGFVFAYLSRRRPWVKAVLFASTIPIALAVNVIRVAGTGLIYAYIDPSLAQGFLHFFEGYLLFLGGIVLFFIEYRAVLFLADRLELATK